MPRRLRARFLVAWKTKVSCLPYFSQDPLKPWIRLLIAMMHTPIIRETALRA
jgi:hypothetical protein